MPRLLLFLLCLPAIAAPPTFYKDIAPITYTYCAGCHHTGESAPFPLVTYSDVEKRAVQIGQVTRMRYMPPWPPQVGYGHFAGERRLTDAQIRAIQEWIAQGAPAGSPSDGPPEPHFTPGWKLGVPDLIVQAPQLFTLRAGGPDVFWNFVLRSPVDRTRFVKAIEIRPGNARIVHHANVLIDRAHSSRLREKTPGSGFEGMDLEIEADTFDPDSHFLFWKPGSVPDVQPPGLAWRLDPGDDLVLNVHLQPSGAPEHVQPSIGLYFTDAPQTRYPMLIQLEHDGNLDIPPGARDFTVTDSFCVPMDLDVLGVYPHAHYLGKLLEGFATLPDGTQQPLIRIPDWDLNWQAVYRYAKPVFLPRGSVISMRFHYDNSAANPRNPHHPPQRVVGGNQTTDEMGHLWLQVLPRGDKDQRAVLQEAIMRHRLEKYPADYSAHFNLGALYLARGQANEALPYFQDALRSEPEQAAALNALGAALMALDKEAEAIPILEHALRLQPGYTNARYNLGNALADMGQFAPAAENLRKVVQENPDDATARRHLALVLQQLSSHNK